uniref:N-acetyltransferase domain-containing protein n=1 Tax=viral metagenome TaxID=1070528 RepID=A0A6C0JB90_9ZZZZ
MTDDFTDINKRAKKVYKSLKEDGYIINEIDNVKEGKKIYNSLTEEEQEDYDKVYKQTKQEAVDLFVDYHNMANNENVSLVVESNIKLQIEKLFLYIEKISCEESAIGIYNEACEQIDSEILPISSLMRLKLYPDFLPEFNFQYPIEQLKSYESRSRIKNIAKLFKGIEKLTILNDLNTEYTELYLTEISNKIRSFVILKKINYDPFHRHKDPYIIKYMYTFPPFRRKGYAKNLINYLQVTYKEMTGFSNSDESNVFLLENGFNLMNDDIEKAIFTYP